MEQLLQSNENKVSLLTIPLSDLDAGNNNETLLLQLPPKWSVKDLKDAHFVATRTPSTSQQAAIVTKNKSFSLYHVETSNALIMVPPMLQQQQHGGTAAAASNKRSKVTESGKILTVTPARLLKMGGSGASFLELREKKLRCTDLLAALKGRVLDPYNNNNNNNNNGGGGGSGDGAATASTTAATAAGGGCTVFNLAAQLQSSMHEVQRGLEQIQAYALPRTEPPQYVLLAEEAQQECYSAILSALSEADNCQDYANDGIIPDNFVDEEVLERMSEDEKFDDADSVIRHCLRQLRDAKRSSTSTLRLDVSKVAACVARRLFQKQTEPWAEDALFSAWQSELPGVGKQYQVKREMLAGLAVNCVSEDGEQRLWKYLPADKMPTDATACFKALFSAKERWYIHELEPYLERLADAITPRTSQADLLLRFTKLVTEDRDGITVKLYQKK